jgi:ubiquinone/menaquinone biosynthesis C-methylase UbiE
MTSVDYDVVASTYDRRYDHNRFDGIRDTLLQFIADAHDADVAEVGCGTGHWLGEVASIARSVVGIDPSWPMLENAAATGHDSLLIRARAEEIPLGAARLDRLFCINALHHFGDARAFAHEARRVLRRDGAVLIIGLDPHAALDRWWIYDYFPSALPADRARYPSTPAIRALLEDAGFGNVTTRVAQHIPAALPFSLAVECGYVDRRATSQLMIISDDEYDEGFARLTAERPVLRADLRLFATIGYVH